MSERSRRRILPDDKEPAKAQPTPEEVDFQLWEKELATPDAPDTDPDRAPGIVSEQPASGEAMSDADEVKLEIAAQPDAEVRYTDAEILGRRYPIRQAVREIGNQRIKAIESAQAKASNAWDTPGKLRRQLWATMAEGRYNRQKERLDAVAHLPDNHFLKRRRLAKLTLLEGKMNRAKQSLEERVNTMENRTKSVGENAERRRAEYRAELKGRREAALARRTLRHELRAQGAGVFESNAILKEISLEHMRRVGRIAAQAETSRRAHGQADRAEEKAAKQEAAVIQAAEKNEKRITQYTEEADNADRVLAELAGGDDPSHPMEGSLPFKEAHLAKLQSQLESLDGDDPDRTALQVQIDEAQHAVDIIVQREIPYWKSVAEQSRQRAKTLTYERGRFRRQHEAAHAAVTQAAEKTRQQQDILAQDTAARTTTAHNSLTNERTD